MSDDSWWLDYNDLDDEQKRLIVLPADKSHLVLGPPGSGKTNVLLLQGSYLASSGKPNIALLIFTRSLREFITRGASKYKVPDDRITTIMNWALRLLREQGIPISDLPTAFAERRAAIMVRILELLDRRTSLERSIECVLVDEAQDCLPEEIDVFFRVGRTMLLAGDSRQRIYRGPDVLSALRPRVTVHELRFHYRNGREICRAADAIASMCGETPILPTCNYKEAVNPSRVECLQCTTEADLYAGVMERLTVELKAYPGELLAVACPRNEDVESIRMHLLGSSLRASIFESNSLTSKDRFIFVGTLHELKGLEFRAVHLAHLESISRLGEVQRRLFYTSVTRAKTRLTLYWIDRAPAYVEQVASVVEPPRPAPDPRSLFPGRS